MKRTIQYCFIFLALVITRQGAFAQVSNHKIHSIFIYNFAKYTQWPTSVQSGDFVIEVLGRSPLADELESCAWSARPTDAGTRYTPVTIIHTAYQAALVSGDKTSVTTRGSRSVGARSDRLTR